jgi:type VI protein secretion system component VasK
MLLVMNGSILSYRHGPTTPRQFDWPSATPAVRLTFGPPIPGEISSAEFRGPWALHRLLARATRQTSTKPEETLFRIDLGARWTVLSLRASSPANPFSVGVFDGLRCPEAL